MARRNALGSDALAELMTQAQGKADKAERTEKRTQAGKAEKRRKTEYSELPDKAGRKRGKERVTLHLEAQLLDAVRNACWWDRDTLADFAQIALTAELRRREEARGEAYPQRAGELKPGRPVT